MNKNLKIVIVIMIFVLLLAVILMFSFENYIQEKAFQDFTIFQVEMLSYCVNQTNYSSFEDFSDDFLRYKTEQLINESK